MLLRVLEEANLYGVYITISRSDSLQFLASGNNFLVTGVWGIRKGWNITNAEYPCGTSREIPLQVHDSNMKEEDLVEGNPDDGEESADDDPTPKSRKLARRQWQWRRQRGVGGGSTATAAACQQGGGDGHTRQAFTSPLNSNTSRLQLVCL